MVKQWSGISTRYLTLGLKIVIVCRDRLSGRVSVDFVEDGEFVISPSAAAVTESFRGEEHLIELRLAVEPKWASFCTFRTFGRHCSCFLRGNLSHAQRRDRVPLASLVPLTGSETLHVRVRPLATMSSVILPLLHTGTVSGSAVNLKVLRHAAVCGGESADKSLITLPVRAHTRSIQLLQVY